MIVHQIYAMIDNTNIIQNIMVCENYEEANKITRAVYGEGALAVDCLQYPCKIGDTYHDSRFWKVQEDGVEIEMEYIPTQEQQVLELNQQLIDSEVALAAQYERNRLTQENVTDLQLALVNIYEK